MSAAAPLDATLTATQAFQALERAVEHNRLCRGVLLHGDSLATLETVCHHLARLHLQTPLEAPRHPDFFALRPQGRARFINVGSKSERVGGEWPPNSMRRLLHDLQLSPQSGNRKIAVIYEAERMNTTAANAFLKTLEEPPPQTILFLLTTRPYHLLPTIRSRCLNFYLPATQTTLLQDPNWQQWLSDYGCWIRNLIETKIDRAQTTEIVMTVYGLLTQFQHILEQLTHAAWKDYADSLQEELNSETKAALEIGFKKNIRAQLFAEIETHTRDCALRKLSAPPTRALTQSIHELERCAGLLEVNLNESAALEAFLLKSMRFWSAS